MHALALAAAALAGLAGAAAACPDPAERGRLHALSGDLLWTPDSFEVAAGGDLALAGCPEVPFRIGRFASAPDLTFDLTDMRPYRLKLRVSSPCDALLLVGTADKSWLFDDDSHGTLDPTLVIASPGDGRLDVWVGTFDGEGCPATLTLGTFHR